ncbi:hypothetical protein F5Y19DRAFT_476271 [Xylariaceae sp. FL1651]|nr:hypothetical protein F5Y19DRAFT_476271 [Xylariaceae sp. FL1651]
MKMQPRQPIATLLFGAIAATHAHTVITYSGWRGDNLILNGTVVETNGRWRGFLGLGAGAPVWNAMDISIGGLPIAENRTNWPVTGGAVSFQPGWFTGHKNARLYVNIGLGALPPIYSVPLVPAFDIVGPTDDPYPGSVCLPQVPIPQAFDVKAGDFATLQVVELAVHGAAMYSCVDITFADTADVTPPNETNCFNSSTRYLIWVQFVGRCTVHDGNEFARATLRDQDQFSGRLTADER